MHSVTRYRINQISLSLRESREAIIKKACSRLKLKEAEIEAWHIVRESLDARNKSDIHRVYSITFDIKTAKGAEGVALMKKLKKAGAVEVKEKNYVVPEVKGAVYKAKEGNRPVIVGFGPAGMFAGLILAEAGLKPLIVERGKDVDARARDVQRLWDSGILDPESNVQFGEGGAGAFSDGKLTTGIKDERIGKVLSELVRFGAPSEILYKQKPHIGTDLLRCVVKNIREKIKELGGEIRFETKVTGICQRPSPQGIPAVTGIRVSAGNPDSVDIGGSGKAAVEAGRLSKADEEIIPCGCVILALGHSARDSFEMLKDMGIPMEQKPFSIGFRIEHPQELIDIAQYGKPAGELGLPPAEYKLSYRCTGEGSERGRGVYTFCMCPGGRVILASTEKDGVVVNGMSLHARDSGLANSALLCDVRPEDFGDGDVLAGVRFQQKYERLACLASGGAQRPPEAAWGALRDGKAPRLESCVPEFAMAAFRQAMPEMGRRLKGFDSDEARVYAVETRSSSPVRIIRRGDGQSPALKGLFPCGEGAGYAGGIVSAAVDGIKMAEACILSELLNT